MKPPNTKTVLEAALALETSPRNVLRLIADGKLRAINTSNGKQRPRWAILNESIDSIGREPAPHLKITQHV